MGRFSLRVALSLLWAACGAAGCLDLQADKPACFGDACGGTVTLDLAPCLGGADASACRGRVDALVAGEGDNACLVLETLEGEVQRSARRWADGALTEGAPLALPPPGSRLRAALFFLRTGDPCGGLRVDAPCDGACILKLGAVEGVAARAGGLTFDFRDGDACAVAWAAGAAPAETCDLRDEDCDGRADEDFPTLGDACSDGEGACERSGFVVCHEGAARCSAVAARPEECAPACEGGECCDAGAAPRACGDDGVCAGTRACIVADGAVQGTWGPCLDADGMPVPEAGDLAERCNGLDDDCDGDVDEGFGVAQRCTVGRGVCERVGALVCRADGSAECDAIAGVGSDEICDGLDNDCDDSTDEGLGLGEACHHGIGACRHEGMTVCDAGGGVVCNASAGPASDELCGDAADNDCDGSTDEGFDEVGTSCTVGVGVCEQTGQFVCDPRDATRTTCDRQPGMPRDEVCDLLDNDCDTQVDEDFNLQFDAANCGRCGSVCDLPNARPRCEAGECTIEALDCLGGFRDQDGVVGNGCECNPNAPDAPDPGPIFTDGNCDGVDGDAERSVFVSTAHGSDHAGTGRIDGPYRTLLHAVSVARLVDAAVLADAGTYDLDGETLVVPAGVSIHGGYRYDPIGHTWSRGTREVNPTIITGASVVLRYEDLHETTMLDNVVVRADDAAMDESSVALLAVNVGDHLVLRNVRAEAGRGGRGTDGEDGRAGSLTAAPGLRGLSIDDASCAGCGGSGGVNNACPSGTAGGRGGDGMRARNAAGAARAGDPGAGDGAGSGGPPGGPLASGGDGDPGDDGPHGQNAVSSAPEGRMDDVIRDGSPALLWLPRLSGVAGTGTPGSGGGGGGGGGAINAASGIGGGGGGGGAGGCAGSGGRAASGGGGSFALQVVGGSVHLRECELVAGEGGDGGEGGTGGTGAPGSTGSPGGGRGSCPNCGTGGDGGDGGRGGCGGNSGGGAGGPSFALFRVSTNQLPENLALSTVVYETVEGEAVAEPAVAAARTLLPGQPGRGGAGGGVEGCGAAAASGREGYGGPEGCCRRSAPSPDCGDLTVCEVQ